MFVFAQASTPLAEAEPRQLFPDADVPEEYRGINGHVHETEFGSGKGSR
jgi:hypothetical protein